jgi:aminopeptidase-like protein
MEFAIMISQSEQLVGEIDNYLKRLFPITRSITGEGNRETLRILQEIAPLEIKKYSSGEEVYDWTIPDEWTVRGAWIKDLDGNKLVDFEQSNIHLVSYSVPIHRKITFEELKKHLHTHPDLSDAIPYRTTYYKRDWGFSVTHKQYSILENVTGLLEVKVDSSFNCNGSLTIGELLIPGTSKEEILISTYICHPSLANDNLSGMIMTAFLARELMKIKNLTRSYRIVWVPETIGAIVYCAMNEEKIKNIKSGLVVTTVGGPGKYSYKQSFNSEHSINLIIEEIFNKEKIDYKRYLFDIHGSDERQYSSQGFKINMASIHKDRYYEYPFYHTSLDNLDFVKAEYIEKTLQIHLKVLNKLNQENVYKSTQRYGEIMLSKYNLYPKTGGAITPKKLDISNLDLILWLLWMCDGYTGIYQIAKKLEVSINELDASLKLLIGKKLLEVVV